MSVSARFLKNTTKISSVPESAQRENVSESLATRERVSANIPERMSLSDSERERERIQTQNKF